MSPTPLRGLTMNRVCFLFLENTFIQCSKSNIIRVCLSCCRHLWMVWQEMPTPPGLQISPLDSRGPWMTTVLLWSWCQWQCISAYKFYTISKSEKVHKRLWFMSTSIQNVWLSPFLINVLHNNYHYLVVFVFMSYDHEHILNFPFFISWQS